MSDEIKKPNKNVEDIEDLLKSVEDDIDELRNQKNTPRNHEVSAIVPLHVVQLPLGKRGVGRPRKIEKAGGRADLAYHAEIQRQQDDFISRDEVFKAIQENKETPEVLHLIRLRIAKAAAALEFHRVEMQKYGKWGSDLGQVVARQVSTLKELAVLEFEVKKLQENKIDLHDERLQKVFKFFVQRIGDVAKSLLNAEQYDLFMNQLKTTLANWESEAESLLR